MRKIYKELGDTVLPRRIQEAYLRVPEYRDALRSSSKLDLDIWKKLLEMNSGTHQTYYICHNLTGPKVRALLRKAPELDDDHRRWDMDMAVRDWLIGHKVDEKLGRMVLRSGLPNAAKAVLWSPLVTSGLKVKVARNAYRAERTAWLVKTAPEEVTDDEVWALITAPDTIERACQGSMLDDRLKQAETVKAAELFHARPGLRKRALDGEHPRLLMAVSAVKLTPEEQDLLIETHQRMWHGGDIEDLMENVSEGLLRGHGYNNRRRIDPLMNVANTPWCTPRLWDHVRDGHNAQVQVHDDRLVCMDQLGYKRHSRLRDVNQQPGGNVLKMDEDEVEAWLSSAIYDVTLSAPYVALEMLQVKDLSRSLVSRRAQAIKVNVDGLKELLETMGRRYVNVLKSAEKPSVPFKRESEPYLLAELDTLCRDALYPEYDLGMKVLLESCMTDDELDVALLLLVEEYPGTLRELIHTAQTI